MTNPIVTIEMENGDIMKAELYPEVAPNTVNNFVSLVKKGYYDGLIFHRVINGFMIQEDARTEQEWEARDTQLKESLLRTVSQIILHIQKVYFLWQELCIRIQQVHSSLSCIKLHHIWTVHMLHLVRSSKEWIL